jgi:enterochelin esterase-like enzyme
MSSGPREADSVNLPLVLKVPPISYTPTGRRDLRLDFLRGFCALAMIIDHVGGASWLYALTGGNRFYTSAAEGFVFISGLVVGLVYRGFLEADGLGVALRRLMERAAQLYLVAVGLTLTFVPLSEMLSLPWAQGIDLSDPAAFVVSVLTLHRTYYVVDIPLLYALLLAAAVPALVLLSQGRTTLVLGFSWVLWAAYQFFPDQADVPWQIAGNYAFHFSAWQVLFITAMVLGYHRERVAAALAGVPRWPALVVSGVVFAGLVQLYRLGDAVWRRLPVEDPSTLDVTEIIVALFGKGDLRPGRIIAFAIVFIFLYLLVDRFWGLWNHTLGWLMLPLGQSALYAYSVHVVFVIAIALILSWLPMLPGTERGLKTLHTLIQLALIGLTWLMIRWQVFMPRGRNWPLWVGSTAALAFACLIVLPLDPTPSLPGWGAGVVEAASSADPRVARAFGTPVPKDGRAPDFAQRQPIIRRGPRPGAAAANAPGSNPTGISPYVGAIRGSFRQQYFYSRALDTSGLEAEMPYFIYLPPDYNAAGRRYPVLYMLHGAAASYEEWLAYGYVDTLDRMIASMEVQPVIVVFPQGDYAYWVNHVDGGPRWADYVARDLVRHIDATFRTLPMAARRGVGGLSMGGHGALQLAFNYPRVFGVAGAHSPSLREDDGEIPFIGTGDEWDRRDPVWLAENAPGLDSLRVWIDVGDEDVYFTRSEMVRDNLLERGVDVVWHGQEGREHGDWELYIEEYVRYYDWALNPR